MTQILGIMTGTSCDGLDAACLKFQASRWKPAWFQSRPYPLSLKQEVLSLQNLGNKITLRDLLLIQKKYSTWCAQAILDILKTIPKKSRPAALAIHGQTVAHFPKDFTTLQLLEPCLVSALTGLTVISHFREGDQAAGGQGAPLAPRFHLELFPKAKSTERFVIHNLGGISNTTVIGPHRDIFAFDTGPANLWIDDSVRLISKGKLQFDKNGDLAKKGKADQRIVSKILSHSFFDLPPPKSTGRDDFPFEQFVGQFSNPQTPDLVATAAEITVQSIVRAYQDWILTTKVKATYLCGGGAKNLFLVNRLQEELPEAHFTPISRLGFEPEYIESSAFSLLGFIALKGGNTNGPWTGATKPGPAASITPGANWKLLLKQLEKSKK